MFLNICFINEKNIGITLSRLTNFKIILKIFVGGITSRKNSAYLGHPVRME